MRQEEQSNPAEPGSTYKGVGRIAASPAERVLLRSRTAFLPPATVGGSIVHRTLFFPEILCETWQESQLFPNESVIHHTPITHSVHAAFGSRSIIPGIIYEVLYMMVTLFLSRGCAKLATTFCLSWLWKGCCAASCPLSGQSCRLPAMNWVHSISMSESKPERYVVEENSLRNFGVFFFFPRPPTPPKYFSPMP